MNLLLSLVAIAFSNPVFASHQSSICKLVVNQPGEACLQGALRCYGGFDELNPGGPTSAEVCECMYGSYKTAGNIILLLNNNEISRYSLKEMSKAKAAVDKLEAKGACIFIE